ncbi:hypothetical protein ACP70R_016455 [Stipagrostis hirtigluma subsp. patula]
MASNAISSFPSDGAKSSSIPAMEPEMEKMGEKCFFIPYGWAVVLWATRVVATAIDCLHSGYGLVQRLMGIANHSLGPTVISQNAGSINSTASAKLAFDAFRKRW